METTAIRLNSLLNTVILVVNSPSVQTQYPKTMIILPTSRPSKFTRYLFTLLCSLVLGFIGFVIPGNSQAALEMVMDPLQFLNTHPSELRATRSQEDAIQLFFQSNPSILPKLINQRSSPNSPAKIQIPPQVQESITHIMAGLVALQTIQDHPDLDLSSGEYPSTPVLETLTLDSLSWMKNTPAFTPLTELIGLYQALSSLPATTESSVKEPDQAYRRFEEDVLTQYPLDAEGQTSWMTILKEQGLQGIQARLNEYQPSPAPPANSTASTIALYSQKFLRTHLTPVIQAYLQHTSQDVQRQAFEMILTHIPAITHWRQQEEERTMLARLCGSWHWTIHNHQNHQDHKMTVHFHPPGQAVPPNQPTPSSFTVYGDTVYLEWIFQQGKQEDSLLLSNQDTILEGTFQSTMGPYGSISGKRMTTCQP